MSSETIQLEHLFMNNYIISGISLPYAENESEARRIAEKHLRRVGLLNYNNIKLRKKSIDSRKKNNIKFVYTYIFSTDNNIENDLTGKYKIVKVKEKDKIVYGNKEYKRPVIIGFGPAGMFSALYLAKHGYYPLVLERGDNICRRVEKVKEYVEFKKLDINSNIQFGAGGAGTFSDGKLATRISDPYIDEILNEFYECGADENILYNSKPHIGTDKLRKIIPNIEKRIKEYGGEIIYNCKVTDFNINNGIITSLITDIGEIECGTVILATGNGAYDVYENLIIKNNILTEKKNYSIGLRIEHLRKDIDKSLYGDFAGDELLGAASYNCSYKDAGSCVYTFCMCPGGFVVPSASENGTVITNGMSYSTRDGINSNVALVVEINPGNSLEFRKTIERKAFESGGGNGNAPICLLSDYLNGFKGSEPSKILPTYGNSKNYTITDLNLILPDIINKTIKKGIDVFAKKISCFNDPEAVLTAAETRTSAPLRIKRNEERVSPSVTNLYPAGEGAGYAGGITSSAVDGINTALKIINTYKPK